MVKSEIIEKEDCRRVLRIEVPAEAVKAEYDKVYKELARQATVPGFRRGKAPFSVIKSRYEAEAGAEVVRTLVGSSLNQAVKTASLEIICEPVICDIEFKPEAPLSYKAELEVRPEVKLGPYQKFKLARRVKKITPPDVEEGLKEIQERLARYVTVEGRALAHQDYAMVDLNINEAGAERFKREGMLIHVSDEHFGQGFSEKVSGLNKGEEREFDLKVPDKDKEAPQKELHFRIKLREIKEKRLSPLDDELAKDVRFNTLEELRADIRRRLESREEEKTFGDLKRQVDELLLKDGEVVPPESQVKKREEYWLAEILRDLEWQGKKDEFKARQDEWQKKMRDVSLKEIKVAYLLDEIGRREQIEANEEEIGSDLKKISGDSDEALKNSRERLKKEGLWDSYVSRIREGKIYQFIINSALLAEEEWK
jgi:trigger factor